MIRVLCPILAGILLMVASPHRSNAAELLATMGSYRRYLDEPAAFTYGVAVKVPVSRWVSLRPELLADNGKEYSNVVVLGSVMGDFTRPEKRAVGYWIASAGGTRTREQRFAFHSWQWALLGGAGVRLKLGERWSAATEVRTGMPAFPLFTVNVGYRWGSER